MKYRVQKDGMEVEKHGHKFNDGKYQLDMIDFMDGTPRMLGEFDTAEDAQKFAQNQKMSQQDLGKLMRYDFIYIEEIDDDDEFTGTYIEFYVPGCIEE